MDPKKEAIAKKIIELPAGTKERQAWDALGVDSEGKELLPRHEFRELWFETRIQAEAKQKTKGNEENGQVKK